ncbi:unnamed protein product, partial [Medioppia subpectinata]
SKAIHVRNTWAKRCDRHLFLSSRDNASLPAVRLCDTDDRAHLWCKTKAGMRYIHEKYLDDYDWVLKADDDTYVIMENLRQFLASHSPQELLYFGCKLQYERVKYMMGGAGYVLSRAAVTKFVTVGIGSKTDSSLCLAGTDTGAEDLEMGRCLQHIGVPAGDSRDDKQMARFLPISPLHLVLPNSDIYKHVPWFRYYSVYPHRSGPECCSPTPISFHYVPINIMYLMDFLLYNVNVIQ